MTEPLMAQLKAELANIDREISDLTDRREAVSRLLQMYSKPKRSSLAPENGKRVPTVEMAERTLEEYGKPLGATELSRMIRTKYGVEPAPSLQQILYNHAKKGDRFHRDGGGKYGLLKWRNRKGENI